nr:hypothetical protein [Desulfobulbaceae bacterium]
MRWEYPKYVSVAEKKDKAAKKLKQLQKKDPAINPVVITGNSLAQTWWGKSWNKNLERYADYSNRIGRGRSYVRHGAVLDLKIEAGLVLALVQGSGAKPYEVVIKIAAISAANWTAIKRGSAGKLQSLQDLLAGKFPVGLSDIFFSKDKGLFPSPREISLDCSCPDWATMCKHVAAALYGVGARFDEDPSLFFKLRQADTGDLIAQAVKEKTGKLLAKTNKKSAKIIVDADLSDIFGIDMDSKPDFSRKIKEGPEKDRKKAVATKASAKKAVQPVNPPVMELSKAPAPSDATGFVAEIIVGSRRKGVTIEMLVEKTGYSKSKLYGIVHRLKQQGEIENRSRGVYVKI